jgi:hypothetical protein
MSSCLDEVLSLGHYLCSPINQPDLLVTKKGAVQLRFPAVFYVGLIHEPRRADLVNLCFKFLETERGL